jgi:hypothetical protein
MSSVSLYASTFAEWKRECFKNVFNAFKNGNYTKEIDDIAKSYNDFNSPLICYTLGLLLIYIVGIIMFKYSQIMQNNNNNNNIEITSKMLAFLTFLYAIVLCLKLAMFYISDLN